MMTSSNGNIFRVTVNGIHRSPVDPSHKGQWNGALMFPLICVKKKKKKKHDWAGKRGAGDLRRHRDQYEVTVMNQLPDDNDVPFFLTKFDET